MKKKIFVFLCALMVAVLSFMLMGCPNDKVDLEDTTKWHLVLEDPNMEPETVDVYYGSSGCSRELSGKTWYFDAEITYHFQGYETNWYPKATFYIGDESYYYVRKGRSHRYDEWSETHENWETWDSKDIKSTGIYRVYMEVSKDFDNPSADVWSVSLLINVV